MSYGEYHVCKTCGSKELVFQVYHKLNEFGKYEGDGYYCKRCKLPYAKREGDMVYHSRLLPGVENFFNSEGTVSFIPVYFEKNESNMPANFWKNGALRSVI